ncbi:MAG: B12-binding domain-containing radical SAM protein [Victivallales bacterium]|nr:B12-binding domain-containing radical SAM protein [Victivallales bacterium]
MFALITPPLVQLNTPYPATPVLLNELRRHGHAVIQRDFSLETVLRLMTPKTVRLAEKAARKLHNRDDRLEFFLESADDYFHTVDHVIAFLQGHRPELAWRIAARTWLPEGPFFQSLYPDDSDDSDKETLEQAFGKLGTVDQAKYLASLYLDDLASFITTTLDPDFGFGNYAQTLTVNLPSMTPLLQRLDAPPTIVDTIIDDLTDDLLATSSPDAVGLTVPFPGTLYGAFRIARRIRQKAPNTKLVLGGGYVNSELRNIEDKRVFDFFDFISYDDGIQPLLTILEDTDAPQQPSDCHCVRLLTRDGARPVAPESPPSLLVPDYDGLNLDDYFDIVVMPNPLHRIWTDGKWLKMQLAHGCYWHRCAFCDIALDYISHYRPAAATDIVDAMEHLVETTEHSGFHFVDEALAPALVKAVSTELIRRKLPVTWWGNIRFDTAFTPELAQLMADSGCIAVTGGLECANDRLLKLMNKGITLASAHKAFQAFADTGILVHAYLMYAFPTETEKEALDALEFVRKCFADGLLQSAYWHRFALTAHSPIAKNPESLGIRIRQTPQKEPRFALNELPYDEPGSPDWNRIGQALKTALYNYMLGLGLDLPVRRWLR